MLCEQKINRLGGALMASRNRSYQPNVTEPEGDNSTAAMIERRVAVAALQIQAQFQAMTKLIDQRVDGNKEQSKARLDALDNLIVTRVQALRDYTDAIVAAERTRADERWAGWRATITLQAEGISQVAERRVEALERLTDAHFEATDKARELQATEYERRLEILNHEHSRLDQVQATYVRDDIYGKDMERLYQERQAQQSQAENFRTAQEIATATNRRTTLLTMVTAAVSLMAVIISIVLHFSPGVPGAGP